MKALKITLTHGKIWTAETSSGVRAQSSTLEGALGQLIPKPAGGETFGALGRLLDGIPDTGGDGNIGHGRAAG